jgi:serine/threonine protein kinase
MHLCALSLFSIIYRDLKPDNIGFDVRGDVKIFDFGLAKEFDPAKKAADGTYKLTADTGSLRYMAPEGKTL